VSSPSAAPVRVAGSRTRSGNAMLRTRTAILDAAADCVAARGVRRTTMGDVTAQAGVAKATLYNHFRTKDDLMVALLESRIARLGAECSELAGAGLPPALEHAAGELSGSAPLRRLSLDEPGVIAVLASPGEGRLWDLARSGVATALREAGAPSHPVAVDVVLRWLCGHLLSAASPDEVGLGARVVADGLGRAPEPLSVADEPPTPYGNVGWPS
jgi:AcrR family transcriptional regulator